MTKLRIDLFNSTVEVDGEESFVRLVYDDFKGQLAGAGQKVAINIQKPTEGHSPLTEAVSLAKKPIDKRPKASFSIIKDLDLSSNNDKPSLREFYASRSPRSALECNAVFVYYLQQIANVKPIAIDHIYSCYKALNLKYPNALKQSIADTSSRKGWLDTSSFEDIKLATPGENYVEHDLPK